ncbi:hypothetical protein ACQEVY_34015 [Streptomyces sp. CA-288835]|uniref:hypothetical protein n=1 Tax=Streptomyces sp. CA-288835 TaxID=3240069 RepID=UPI003D905398
MTKPRLVTTLRSPARRRPLVDGPTSPLDLAGWPISWLTLARDENEDASVKSFLGDNQPLERMLDRLVSEESG